ncbi:MAG: hypothetical protein RLY97_685, partial [Pseudomonadota bacterium]
MSGGNTIAAVEPQGDFAAGTDMSHASAPDAPLHLSSDWAAEDDEADDTKMPHPLARFDRWALSIALLALTLWSGFFIWANFSGIIANVSASPNPAQWGGWLSAWSGPVLLIGLAWLIITRSNRNEAMRFAETARLLSDESARLEMRLVTVNQELSLAREFIAAQSRDLDAVGRQAVDRLSQHAAKLTMLIRDN